MKNLHIDRPIAFIDVETTGLSVLKIEPDGTEEQKTKRFNPQIPIATEAIEVHGITDEDVAGEPIFERFARSLSDYLEGCDIAGFGVIRFDLPFLEAELKSAGVEFSRQGRRILDAKLIYYELDPL